MGDGPMGGGPMGEGGPCSRCRQREGVNPAPFPGGNQPDSILSEVSPFQNGDSVQSGDILGGGFSNQTTPQEGTVDSQGILGGGSSAVPGEQVIDPTQLFEKKPERELSTDEFFQQQIPNSKPDTHQ